MELNADVIVVGSGISGAFAAHELVSQGLKVLMIDVGHDDAASRDAIPDLPFSDIIKDPVLSRSIFLGEDNEGIGARGTRVGAQLTPPRHFITRDTEKFLPYESKTFFPMQSLALGGLGAGWGAACFTFDADELRRCGIWQPDFNTFYSEATAIAGVSASHEEDTSDALEVDPRLLQPALDLDENNQSILNRYKTLRLSARGPFAMGRIPLAILSRDREDGRQANPYFDMDFYSDARRSIFRPRYLIERLQARPNYQYAGKQLATSVSDGGDFAEIRTLDVETGEARAWRARKIILCASAINTARIVLTSLGNLESKVPLLANPYRYVVCLNWDTFGRSVADRRHSMAQLLGMHRPPDNPRDLMTFQMYSYRSLLLFKLAKEFPLPPDLGFLFARTIVNSLSIVAVWHSADQSTLSQAAIGRHDRDLGVPSLEFTHAIEPARRQQMISREKHLRRFLRKLRLLPLKTVDTGPAGGIHYAGTLPSESQHFTAHTRSTGQVKAMPSVYVGDSSSWNFLPAKGLSFTLMANAIRIARHVATSIKANASDVRIS